MNVSMLLPLFGDDLAGALRIARRAEELGLGGVFVSDHFGSSGRPTLDGPTVLAAAASVTSRIRVGSLVLRAPARPAWTTAHLAWTVQAISGGRMVLGLGATDRTAATEFAAYRLPFPAWEARLRALRETIEAVSRPELALPGVDRPPVWVGGASDEIRRLAASADGWNRWGGSPEDLQSGAEEVRRSAGGPVTVSWAGKVLVDPDTDRIGEADLVAGEAARVVQELMAYFEAGADELVLAVLPARDPEALDRFAEAVLPELGS